MKLPRFDDFEFSALAWKEWLLDIANFGSKRRISEYLIERNREGYFEDCSAIKNYVRNRRIRRLLNGYAILDLLDWKKRSLEFEFARVKMWRLFEDLVGEILRVAIEAKQECTVAHVDRWPGFRGLDYIIINSKSKLGWKVGVQCKRYVGTRVPYSRVDEYSSYTRGTSASKLYDKGIELQNRFTDKRRFILVMFDAYIKGKLRQQRFNWLNDAWDLVVVFNKPLPDEDSYTYRLYFDEADRIARWC